MKKNKKGFTLVELLVVVLIIGVLAAIALPMYQKAVLKSRFAALMPIAKAMADSNEAYYLEHTQYASNPQDLPVQGQLEYPTGTEVELAPGLEYAYVMASNDLARNNYIVYQKHSNKFADNIHCEALEDDEQANGVCISLGGQLINGSLTDGYKTYVLSGTYGETDKLPTSLTKLKAQLCAGVSEENCVVDESKQTLTSYTCGKLGEASGELSSFLYGTGADANGCIGKEYDLDGNLLGTPKIRCSKGTTPNAEKTHCMGLPNQTYSGYELIHRYDGDNHESVSRSCQEISNNQCTLTYEQAIDYWPNGQEKSRYNYKCATANLNDERGCTVYNIDNYMQQRFNEQGRTTWDVVCSHHNSNGDCTNIVGTGQVNIYDAAGTTRTGYIQASCTVSHTYDTNPCETYSLTYSGNAPSGPATCPASRFNFDTFACAPES